MTTAHDLESVWELREEQLYPALFGDIARGVFVLEPNDFAQLGCGQVDPRWLHLGEFEMAPTPSRPSWVYVTSGGSTPWEDAPDQYDPEAYSWLGVEFLLETPEPADWAIHLLKRLFAFHVLSAHGHFGERPGITLGARIPIRAPLDRGSSALDSVIAVAPPWVAATQSLPSGKFDLVELVGVTGDELAFAKAEGTTALFERLVAAGVGTLTDVRRASVCGG